MAQEKVVIDVEVKAAPAVASVKSLKAELRAITNELMTLEEGSDAFVQAAKKAGQLKDKISDTKDTINAFHPEKKFQALADTVGIAANGFAAMQGAMALMGTENEELNKTIAKTQGAIALATGLNGLMGMGDAWKNLKTTAGDALKGIKTGIAATGIGLLVIALGLIVAYWEDIKGLVSGVDSEQNKLNESTKKNVALEKEKLDALDKQDNILKLQGLSEKEILELKQKQIVEVINATKEQIKQQIITNDAQTKAEIRNKNILKGIVEYVSIPLALVLRHIDYIGKKIGKDFGLLEGYKDSLANMLFDPKEAEKKGEEVNKELKTQLTELENKQAGYTLAIRGIDKKANDDKLAKEKETNKKIKDEKKRIDDWNEERAKGILKTEEGNRDAQKTIDDIATFNKDLDDKEKEKKDKEAKDKHTQDLKEISTNTRLSYEERLEAFRTLAKEQTITATQLKDAEVAIEKEKQAAKTAALQEGANTLNQAADLLGKNTVEGKMLAVAAATISTYLSAQKAFESFQSVPVFGFGLGIAAAAMAVASGVASVNKILSVQVPGQPNAGGAPPVAPSIPRIPQTLSGTMLSGNSTVTTKGSGTINKVIVVETDITEAQNKVSGIIRKATIK